MQTKSKPQKNVFAASPYAQYGIPLGRAALRALEKRGIYCQTSISVEHQHLAKRYVLRGVESGGAVSDMGRYCAFVNMDGTSIPWLQPIDSISPNGRHAVIVAPELVRIEMFRIERTYELSITQHILQTREGHRKPEMVSSLLFRGREGTLGLDLLAKENLPLRGTLAPTFFSESGEMRKIPASFHEAVNIVTTAVNTLASKRAHMALKPSLVLFNYPQHGDVRA